MGKGLALLVVAVLLAAVPGLAGATEIHVDTTVDQAYGSANDGCSLRNAFIAADRNVEVAGCSAGGPTDAIYLPPGDYRLTSGSAGDDDPASGDLDMSGSGEITIWPAAMDDVARIDGGGLDRIFDVSTSMDGYLVLRRLTLTGGKPGTASGDQSDGGAIRLLGGNVRLFGATVVANYAAGDGGAAFISGQSILESKNSTFGFNRAEDDGGAIAMGGDGPAAELLNVTIARNTADVDGDGIGQGGGIGADGSSMVQMENSILARNVDLSSARNRRVTDCASTETVVFPDYLMTTQKPVPGSCRYWSVQPSYPGYFLRAKPRFQGFGMNGGPTPTFAIGYGSPAIGAGGVYEPDRCPSHDQRGEPREPGYCDLGAFQYSAPGIGQLPGKKRPTRKVATFDGIHLRVLVRCPRTFRPTCESQATVLTYPSVGSSAMTEPRRISVPSGAWRSVSFKVLPRYRAKMEAKTHVNYRRLYVRQQIHARRYGKTGKPGWNLEIDMYKVRVKR